MHQVRLARPDELAGASRVAPAAGDHRFGVGQQAPVGPIDRHAEFTGLSDGRPGAPIAADGEQQGVQAAVTGRPGGGEGAQHRHAPVDRRDRRRPVALQEREDAPAAGPAAALDLDVAGRGGGRQGDEPFHLLAVQAEGVDLGEEHQRQGAEAVEAEPATDGGSRVPRG